MARIDWRSIPTGKIDEFFDALNDAYENKPEKKPEDWNVFDYSGGNIDDAYNMGWDDGFHQGWWRFAKHHLEVLNGK